MANTRLIVLRHGETEWNRQGRYQGHLDSALTAAGVAQAHALAQRLARHPVTALYSSDLGRALATAQILAQVTGHEIQIDPRLREQHLGILQGHRADEAREKFSEAYRLLKHGGPDAVIPGGESTRQRHDCAVACLEDLASRHAGEQIAVVTHGGALSCLVRHILRIPLEAPRHFARPNAAWNILLRRPDRWILETWGDVSHLTNALGQNDP